MTITAAQPRDGVKWTVHAHVDKWTPEQVADAEAKLRRGNLSATELEEICAPAEQVDQPGNLLTTAGLARLTSLLTGAGGQAITNTSARIGSGNSSTAEAVGQTDLQASAGSANRWFQVMDATFPSTSNGVVTLKSTFGTSDGNFAWNEWCVDVGTPTVSSANTVNALMFNRKVASNGTKASGATWAFTVTITFS